MRLKLESTRCARAEAKASVACISLADLLEALELLQGIPHDLATGDLFGFEHLGTSLSQVRQLPICHNLP